MTLSPLPLRAHELLVAPAALALAFAHARRALGAPRAAVELLSLAVYGFALERVAILVFASHTYGGGWLAAPWGVPLAVAVVWAAVIASAMALAARLGLRSPGARAAAAALIGVSLDLLIEPAAVRTGLWQWTPAGPWLGVPVGNFVGWGVIVGVYAAGAEAWTGGDDLVRRAARRAALAALSILALLAVGGVWTALRVERLFAGAAGFLAWGAILAATVGVGAPARGMIPPSRASAWAAAPGGEPALVFLGLAAVFAWDALAVGGGTLALVAAGSTLTLGFIVLRSSVGRRVDAEPRPDAASATARQAPLIT